MVVARSALAAVAGLVVVAVLLSAKGVPWSADPSTRSTVAELGPIVPVPSGEAPGCAGLQLTGVIPLRARLTGDGPSPQAQAFGVVGPKELHILWWPAGYKAVFDPEFSRVLTPNGETFARAGEDLNHTGSWRGHYLCFYKETDADGGVGIEIWPEPTPGL